MTSMTLRLGRSDQFARVRTYLNETGYTEETISHYLRLERLSGLLKAERDPAYWAGKEHDPVAWLCRLFLLAEPVPRQVAQNLFPQDVLDCFVALGLVTEQHEQYAAQVCLAAMGGVLVASDPLFAPEGQRGLDRPELVYPAVGGGSRGFVQLLPRREGADVLDIGTGTGIAALALSSVAGHIVATDIAPRCAHFARFNAALNDLHNVTVLEGDLYEPVAGQTFDCITAHPPYVPALADTRVWRDGGQTGERVLQGIISGLPAHLRAGGTFLAMTMGLERKQQRFEDRVREWLGEQQSEFDLILAPYEEFSMEALAMDRGQARSGGTEEDTVRWQDLFRSHGIVGAVRGALALYRRETASGPTDPPPVTVRLKLSDPTDGVAFDWAVQWHRWAGQTGAKAAALRMRPRCSAYLRVKITHAVQAGALVPVEMVVETDRPFAATGRLDEWIVRLLLEFDGSRTAGEVYGLEKAADIPQWLGPEEFGSLILFLISQGFLVLEGTPGSRG